jgi:hypothetical protein
VAGLPAHRLRWRLSDPSGIERWTERRLALDGGYWLFVLGINNSGTTILAELLCSHPEIRSLPGEGQYLTRALPAPLRLSVPRLWTERLDAFRWTETSEAGLASRVRYDWSHFAERGSGILLEKSPPNTVRARWLQEHFRPSRFVALVRHPYPVCEGIRRRTGCTIREAARHWVRGNEILLEDLDRLHRSLWLTYEELTDQPEEQLERLEAFLELRTLFDRRVLDEPIRSHNIYGEPQPLQNMNARSLEHLSPEDAEAIDGIARALMQRLGYESSLCSQT